MTARIIDGKQLAEKLKLQLVPQLARLKEQGIVPSLTVILVGDDPASQVYVNHKANTFNKLGLTSSVETYPAQMTEAELLERIHTLNNDPAINGILVQLPLPPHFNADTVIEAISPAKDVDGFHVSNAGALMIGKPTFIPCTPYGVMKMLEDEQVNIRGAEAVGPGLCHGQRQGDDERLRQGASRQPGSPCRLPRRRPALSAITIFTASGVY